MLKNSAKELIQAIETLDDEVDAYLLDLRNNPGGFLSEVTDMVDAFSQRGLVMQTQGHPQKQQNFGQGLDTNAAYFAKHSEQITYKPIVLISNAGTASAAEVFVGALSAGRALHVGQRTYGKGTVKKRIPISEKSGIGGAINLTMMRYVLFDGTDPQAFGYIPHIEFKDPQLNQVISERKLAGEETILFEFQQKRAIPSIRPRRRPISSPWVARLLKELHDQELLSYSCKGIVADCWLEKSLVFLHTAVSIQPEWRALRLVRVPGTFPTSLSSEKT